MDRAIRRGENGPLHHSILCQVHPLLGLVTVASTRAVPNIARMVNELDDAAARRKTFSRRRAHNDDRDVDSINERNAVFNRKVGRAFDKYTVEIRQNLERGTALPN